MRSLRSAAPGRTPGLDYGGNPVPNYDQSRIRNFCIIAHIDHGKSTLADRILERTGVMQLRDMTDQVLDSMELERERGITIKSKAVRMTYTARDGQVYELNLIDTPGHVDFTYEVSRALAACEGAVLVVDASQGIEAQTLANVYMALEHDLEILPVINKIDLPSATPMACASRLRMRSGWCRRLSADLRQTGRRHRRRAGGHRRQGPRAKDDPDAPLQALIFDSYYDNYAAQSLRCGSRRLGQGWRPHPHDVQRSRVRRHRGRCLPAARICAQRGAARRRGRLYRRVDQGHRRYPRRRHHHARRQAGSGAAAGL